MKEIKTVAIQYDGSPNKYTFMTRRDLKKGDLVVVYTGRRFSLVNVVEVHEEPQLGEGYDYKWIVDKVDISELEAEVRADHTTEVKPEGKVIAEAQVCDDRTGGQYSQGYGSDDEGWL